MNYRIVSPRRVIPAVLVALAGFGPARAADKNDKYTSDKAGDAKSRPATVADRQTRRRRPGPRHRPGRRPAAGRRKGQGVAAGRRRRVSAPRLPRPGRPHPARRQGRRVPRQQRPRQARQADRRIACQRRLRQAHGRRVERPARQAQLRQPHRDLRPAGGLADEGLQPEHALGPDGPRPAHRRGAAGRERRRHLFPGQQHRGQDDGRYDQGVPRRPAPMRPVPQPPVHRLEADGILGHGRFLHEGPADRAAQPRQAGRRAGHRRSRGPPGPQDGRCPIRPRPCRPSSSAAPK